MKPDITATMITFVPNMTLLDRVISTWALVASEYDKEWPRVRDVTKNRVRLVWVSGPHEKTRRIRLADCAVAHDKQLLYEFIIGMTQERHEGREAALIKLDIDPAQIPTRLHQRPYRKDSPDVS